MDDLGAPDEHIGQAQIGVEEYAPWHLQPGLHGFGGDDGERAQAFTFR